MIVFTLSVIVGIRPLVRGQTIIASFASAAVSLCPPEAPRRIPLEPVMTLTLKSISTSKALKITTSSCLILAPLELKFAYSLALISIFLRSTVGLVVSSLAPILCINQTLFQFDLQSVL